MTSAILSNTLEWLNYQVRLVRVGAKRGIPLFVGVGATKLFLVFVLVLAVLPQYSESQWSWRVWSFLTAPSNEIGDTLAGIAGALAFLWIIVTVMMQSKELSAQREELKLTRQEFKAMASAQKQQVSLLREQGRIFKREQKQRLQQIAEATLSERTKILRVELTELNGTALSWTMRRRGGSNQHHRLMDLRETEILPDFEFFRRKNRDLASCYAAILREIEQSEEVVRRPVKEQIERLASRYREIIETVPSSSKTVQIRYEGMAFDEGLTVLDEVSASSHVAPSENK